MVSIVDLLPTVLDSLMFPNPNGSMGVPFIRFYRAKTGKRDFVIKEYNENAGRSRDPMRGIQTKTHLFLFNPWSNGERVFATATNGTVTCKRMIKLAEDDERMNERLELYRYRVPQELYHVKRDPDCLENLIHRPNHEKTKNKLMELLEEWMVQTKDPLLECFQNRDEPDLVEAYIQKLEEESNASAELKRSHVQ